MPSSVTSTNLFRRLLRPAALCAGLAGCLLVLARAQNASGLAAAARSIPVGVENLHAVLPSFDATGRRTSLITADVIRRVDDDRLYAEGFALEQYAADPKENLRIELPAAHYHMTDGVLRSTQRGKVTRGAFQIEGDSLIFDTRTSKGLMQGNIRTVIFDTGGNSGD